LAEKDNPGAAEEEKTLNIERIKRVMEQPLNFSLTCPHCGKNIEITILGSQRPTA
jgi:hypothetical protein